MFVLTYILPTRYFVLIQFQPTEQFRFFGETKMLFIHKKIPPSDYYTPCNEVRGVYWIQPVCLSVCPSVRLSVCLSVNFFVSAL